jgi:DNA topoisomerase I
MPRDLADEADQPLPPGLVYVSDASPGITRRRSGKGFAFIGLDGRTVRDPAERARCLRLAIPPAYRDVWICPLPNGHLQATGLDDAGRKQYRYHPDWQAWRADVKYGQLAAFGAALPRLRRRIARDLEREAGELAFSLAALATLLDRTHIRVGSSAYAERNGTYGATTLLSRHLTLKDGVIRLRYRAKGGRRVSHTLRDKRLHRILQEINDLPGRNLFAYLDENGEPRPVASHHVNAYLAEATGVAGATGKTFRTWAGTLAAFSAARAAGGGRLTVRALCQAAAAELMNTPAICRSSYVHPQVLDLAALPPPARQDRLEAIVPRGPRGLRAEERRLLGFLGD